MHIPVRATTAVRQMSNSAWLPAVSRASRVTVTLRICQECGKEKFGRASLHESAQGTKHTRLPRESTLSMPVESPNCRWTKQKTGRLQEQALQVASRYSPCRTYLCISGVAGGSSGRSSLCVARLLTTVPMTLKGSWASTCRMHGARLIDWVLLCLSASL